ncbi:jasmonate O-methyltransferase-like [Prunus avium]|uniref:Jasmonate O-methyltransferase-like n=1 Tax=Prunus avium TaxID=42229 RepID=A0A6P5TWV5_PRUAV|nr:jasmonate O-methyltransferase-like [Prunus avium]
MEVNQILHMNKGDGENGYAQNSQVQGKILSVAKPIIHEAVLEILSSNNIESMGIADLGCSSGPNTLLPISYIMDAIHAKRSSLGLQLSPSSTTEFRVYLNDLFSNDFNAISMSLPAFYNNLKQEKGPEFGSVFVSAVPGSFHGRLFPAKTLHFVHSSCSIHWLSRVPPALSNTPAEAAGSAFNKGKIYISKTSPQCVLDAYSLQFHEDFSSFLKSRAEEVVGGGRMVLSLLGRPSSDPTTPESCDQWELLAHALMTLVSEGLIEEEKVDAFNIPYYAPCAEELKLEVQKEGSFVMDRVEAFEMDRDASGGESDDMVASGQRVAKSIRVVAESMLESHFGKDIMNHLFRKYAELLGDHLSKFRTKYTNLIISVIRKQ